jgi:hypothetical protein
MLDGAWPAWELLGLAWLGAFGVVRGWSVVRGFIR